jgi:hypothetical protein
VVDVMERLSQVVRREMDLVGVWGAGGVIGLEHSAMVLLREGGARVRRVTRGAEKADPMSERVSERTCMRMEGAI